MGKTRTIQGLIQKDTNDENVEILMVGHDIFAEKFSELLEKNGHLITVSYYISDKMLTLTQAREEFQNKVMGFAESEYNVHYSDCTGYLWTDESTIVGGHNLLNELYTHVGKYLIMEIEFHDEVSFRSGVEEARQIAVNHIEAMINDLSYHLKQPGLTNAETIDRLSVGINTLRECSAQINSKLIRY